MLNEKVGHTGTLDPMATGVLPLLIGKGTLSSKYLINHDKKYKVVLQLGKKTTTADIEGQIIQENNFIKRYDKSFIEKILNSFIGKQKQIPPIYSAIKVNGKKLYEYARNGQDVKIEPRNIEIYNIKLLDYDYNNNQILFEVNCSKGTYIRSLCEDIAYKLDTIGYMSELTRLEVGEFKIENAITIDVLEEFVKNNGLENLNCVENKSIITLEKLFFNNIKIDLNNKELKLFLNGVKLNKVFLNGIYRIYNNDKFIGIGVIDNNYLKRDIIL